MGLHPAISANMRLIALHFTPLNNISSPSVTNAGSDHTYCAAILNLTFLESELKREDLVDLTDVTVVFKVDGLVFGEAEVCKHSLVA